MKIKLGLRVMIVIMLVTLLLSSVSALGVRPTNTQISYSDTYEGTFKVVNNDNSLLKVKLYPEGEIAEFITLAETEIELEPEESFRSVPFTLNIPDDLPPGSLDGRIIIEEQLSGLVLSGNYVSANIKVAHKISVNIPYPNEYIEARFEIDEKEEDIDLTTILKNVGVTGLDKVEPVLEVYGGDEKIALFKHELNNFEVNDEERFTDYIDKENVEPGEYRVEASINYEENSLEMIQSFTVGEPTIEVLNHDQYFEVGRINELGLDLESKWNQKIGGLTAEVIVTKDQEEVYITETTSFELDPKKKKKVTTFFDARNMDVGSYDVELIIGNGEIRKTKNFVATVLTSEEYARRNRSFDGVLIPILIGLLVLVFSVVLILGYFVLSLRKEKFK